MIYKITKDKHVIIKTKYGDVHVGTMKDGSLDITDVDCYYQAKDAYGIDECILLEDNLPFKLITFSKIKLVTTRIYFIDHMNRYSLLNGRVQGFLKRSEFGLVKALKYERDLKRQDLRKLDVFDILALDNPRLYQEWEKTLSNELTINIKL